MKEGIHSNYMEATVKCVCGNEFTTRSTTAKINVEICSACHALYTNEQKDVGPTGRIEKFQRKYAKGYGFKEKQGKS